MERVIFQDLGDKLLCFSAIFIRPMFGGVIQQEYQIAIYDQLQGYDCTRNWNVYIYKLLMVLVFGS